MGTEQARVAAVGRGGPAACMTVAPQGHGKDTKPGPTRRMPSDAQWTEVASRAGDAVSYAFQRSRSPENGDQSRRKAPCFPSPVQKNAVLPGQKSNIRQKTEVPETICLRDLVIFPQFAWVCGKRALFFPPLGAAPAQQKPAPAFAVCRAFWVRAFTPSRDRVPG